MRVIIFGSIVPPQKTIIWKALLASRKTFLMLVVDTQIEARNHPKSRNSKKHCVYHELSFQRVSVNFCLLLCDASQESNRHCSEKLVQMNFFILGGFYWVDFPPSHKPDQKSGKAYLCTTKILALRPFKQVSCRSRNGVCFLFPNHVRLCPLEGPTRKPRQASVFCTHFDTQAVPEFHCIRMFKGICPTCAFWNAPTRCLPMLKEASDISRHASAFKTRVLTRACPLNKKNARFHPSKLCPQVTCWWGRLQSYPGHSGVFPCLKTC